MRHDTGPAAGKTAFVCQLCHGYLGNFPLEALRLQRPSPSLRAMQTQALLTFRLAIGRIETTAANCVDFSHTWDLSAEV